MEKTTLWWIIGIIIVIVGLFGWSKLAQNNDPNIIARSGLHWHPVLNIYVDGEKQEIPANVGLVGGHQSMHTHAEDSAQGVVHLEFGGIVRPDDVRLGNFFRIWNNKDIMSAFGRLERMTVNGKENADYGDYQIQGEDNIELFYTSSLSETPQASFQVMSVTELNEALKEKDFTLVNVHIPYIGDIEGTDLSIPYDEIAQNLNQLPTDKNAKIVLYCQSGSMSAKAAQTLADLGYTNVIDVEGGMIKWQQQGYPLVRK